LVNKILLECSIKISYGQEAVIECAPQ